MRTLVREGAWVFIVVGLDPFSLEKKSFPYRNLLGRILRDPFHIGVPLRFNKTWRASHLFIHANVVSKRSLTSNVSIYNAFGLHTVSFRMTFSFIIPLACGASPQNFIPPSVIWTRTDGPLDPVTYLSWPISFILINYLYK